VCANTHVQNILETTRVKARLGVIDLDPLVLRACTFEGQAFSDLEFMDFQLNSLLDFFLV
jgi:hypothetical protein